MRQAIRQQIEAAQVRAAAREARGVRSHHRRVSPRRQKQLDEHRARREANVLARRDKVDTLRAANGLAPLPEELNWCGLPVSRSRDGICIQCDGEMVMNSEGRHICPYCRRSPENARKFREREEKALAKLNAAIDPHQFNYRADWVRQESSLRDAHLSEIPLGWRPSTIAARRRKSVQPSVVEIRKQRPDAIETGAVLKRAA